MGVEANWAQFIDQALDRVRGGGQTPVPGAKLRQSLAEIVAAHGLDLTEYLGSRNIKFFQLLEEQIEKGAKFVLIRRPGTDLLVAKSGEEIPSEILAHKGRGITSIRSDFYMALTDIISGHKYLYDSEQDQVVSVSLNSQVEIQGSLVELPSTSLAEQLELRRKFAEKFPQLQFNPVGRIEDLTTFQHQARMQGLAKQWHEFKCETLKSKLLTWASNNQLTIRNEWFGNINFIAPQEVGMAQLLKYLADHMTEDELKETKLPLRAIHALWLFQLRRKK